MYKMHNEDDCILSQRFDRKKWTMQIQEQNDSFILLPIWIVILKSWMWSIVQLNLNTVAIFKNENYYKLYREV